MKQILFLITINLFSISAFAQVEIGQRALDVDFEREVYIATINDKKYWNVTVRLIAAEKSNILGGGVKVVVRDSETGKRIYKKRFWKSHLYRFSDGTIKIGKANSHTQILLSESHGYWELELNIDNQ